MPVAVGVTSGFLHSKNRGFLSGRAGHQPLASRVEAEAGEELNPKD